VKPYDAFIYVGARHVTVAVLRGSGESGCRAGANISTDISTVYHAVQCEGPDRYGAVILSIFSCVRSQRF
jgi:hypothetical protein